MSSSNDMVDWLGRMLLLAMHSIWIALIFLRCMEHGDTTGMAIAVACLVFIRRSVE